MGKPRYAADLLEYDHCSCTHLLRLGIQAPEIFSPSAVIDVALTPEQFQDAFSTFDLLHCSFEAAAPLLLILDSAEFNFSYATIRLSTGHRV